MLKRKRNNQMSLNAKQIDKKINKAILRDNVYIFNYLLINLLENNPEYILSGKDYENQDTLLMRSCRHGSKKIVDYLLERKVNIHKQKINGGTTALLLASQNGHYKIVKLLLQNGAKCNVQSRDGFSSIQQAAQNGHYEIVKLLLENGANCNVQSNNGLSPIQQAAQEGHYKIVKLLLQNGANYPLDPISNIYNKKIIKMLTQYQQTKELVTSILPLLALSREFCEDSLFHEEYLPRDLFNVITTCITDEIELKTYYSL